MTIKQRLQELESRLVPDETPAKVLAECDPLSLALFVAEAHGQLAGLTDPNPTPGVRRILEYIRQNPEKYPAE